MTRLSRAAGLVSVATLISRLLGVARESVRWVLFSNKWLSDALDVAFKVPNLFRDLFAEGAFSGAFVPTIMRTHEREGRAKALDLLNRVLSTMLVYVGAICVGIAILAPWIVRLLASDAFLKEPGLFDQAVVLVRVLAPFLLLICLAVAAMGALNAFGRFFVPSLSSAAQNVVLVLGGLVVYKTVTGPAEAVMPYAWLLLLGGLFQFLIQVPSLWRAGWRPRFAPDLRLRTEETRQMLRRMLPVVTGQAATHLCILVNTRLATGHEGGASNLSYAFRLVHLPVGLVGVAVGTAVLAEASRRAAVHDDKGALETLGEALLLCLAFAAPAAAGLLVLGGPIAGMLFPGGEQANPAAVGLTIQWFAPSVIFYCAVKVVVPFFYAQGRTRVPVAGTVVAVAANIACALLTHHWLRWNGLALALGVGQVANLAVLLWAVNALHEGPRPKMLGRLGKIGLATVACGLAAAGAVRLLPAAPGFGARLLRALLPVVAGGVAYLAAGAALRCPEIISLLRGMRRLARLDKTRDRA